jgi:hypothetical protein
MLKRAELVCEINTSLMKGKNASTDVLLKDLHIDDKNNRLKNIAQISMTYLSHQFFLQFVPCHTVSRFVLTFKKFRDDE